MGTFLGTDTRSQTQPDAKGPGVFRWAARRNQTQKSGENSKTGGCRFEAARWQNGWVPVVMRLADEGLSDAQLAEIDQQLYRHTRLGSALRKRWDRGMPGYEGLFDRTIRSLDPSILGLAMTIIRIREWISVRRTLGALGEISAFTGDGPPEMTDMPTNDISEWLETMYNRNEELERLTDETLRLEAEEDVDRLLG